MRISSGSKEKIQSGMASFANNKYIKAISNGMVLLMTPIIIGSICTLIANFPISSWTNFLSANSTLKYMLNLPSQFTINCIGLFAHFLLQAV